MKKLVTVTWSATVLMELPAEMGLKELQTPEMQRYSPLVEQILTKAEEQLQYLSGRHYRRSRRGMRLPNWRMERLTQSK